MRIGVVGIGYVGLATGVGLSRNGHHVICVEKDRDKLSRLKKQQSPIDEPGYPEEAAQALSQNRLIFTDDTKALKDRQVIFITVGTPPLDSGQPDLSALTSAAKEVSSVARDALLVIKSTTPPGTARFVAEITGSAVASNPEFLREGRAIYDFLRPSRIVLGVDRPEHEELLRKVYAGFDVPLVVVDTPTAELSKYASNVFLALKVSYANWLTDVARVAGANASKALQIAGMDPRIGSRYLRPGLGWGGSCLPKDLKAIGWFARQHGVDTALIEAVDRINQTRIQLVLSILEQRLSGIKGKTIAVLGLAFKAGTSDTRESQSLKLVKALVEHGARVKAYDPVARAQAVEQLSSPFQALEDAHAAVFATDWQEFSSLPAEQVISSMRDPVIIDARGILDPEEYRKHGVEIIRLDRGS